MKHIITIIAAVGLTLALPGIASSQGDAKESAAKAAQKKAKPAKPVLRSHRPPSVGSAPTRGGNMAPRNSAAPTVPHRP